MTDTNKAFNELKEYFENLDVSEEIINKLDEMYADGYFDTVINEMLQRQSVVRANVVSNDWRDYNAEAGFVNGSCYIGNNQYAVYFSSNDVDTGSFIIFDALSHEKISETSLTMCHGNSMAYNKNNNKVYVCGAYSVTDINTLIPSIYVVNVDDRNTPILESIITPPLPSFATGIYSLAYDDTYNRFYAICARGVTAGEYNRLICYNSDLSSIISERIITGLVAKSNQGVQYVRNNIAYWVCYDPDYRGLYTFNVNTGELLNIISLPKLINGYRLPGEYQSVIYNYDNDSWFLTSRFLGTGYTGHAGYQILEIGLFKAISYFDVTDTSLANANGRLNMNVEQGANFIATNMRNFICVADAVNASITANVHAVITFTGANMVLGTFDFRNFSGAIQGTTANRLKILNNINIYNSRMRFAYCDFTGNTSHPYIQNDTGNIAIFHSMITILASTFTDKFLASDSIIFNWVHKTHSLRSLLIGPSFVTDSVLTNCGFVQNYS